MKFRAAIAALACVLFATTRGSASPVDVDQCTVVAVEMMDNVDSSTAHPGDFFRFQTVNAVTKRNTIAIPARTIGYGVVAIASPAGRGGRPGTLVLEPRYLKLPNGTKLGVVLNHNTTDLERSGATENMPGYLGAIPVPGVGAAIGVFNYFHNGKNIVVARGTVFTIFPSDDPMVEHCQDHPSY
ncbi:MAG: hypothetical protein ABI282_11355 [Candidatus Baltobacteraceae bacterium]